MKTYHYYLSLVFTVLCSLTLFSQPGIQWQKTLEGSSEDFDLKMIQTHDGNYAFTGNIQSTDGYFSEASEKSDLWIVKMNDSGEVIWKKNHSDDRHIRANDIKATQDGGFIIIATKSAVFQNDDIWVAKLDEIGNLQWDFTKEGQFYSSPHSVIQTTDGDFVIGGYQYSSTPNYNEYWFFKLNNSGELIWEHSEVKPERVTIDKILETDEQEYLAIGNTTINDLIWLLRIDKEGNIFWEKTYDHIYAQSAADGIIASDGSIVICGYKYLAGFEPHFLITKINEDGSIEWERTFGGTGKEFARSISETSDGGYLVAGRSDSSDGDVQQNNGGNDIWVIKLDVDGQLQWSLNHGGPLNEVIGNIISTPDGFIAVGSVRDPNTGRLNCHILKYSSDPTFIVSNTNSNDSFEIFPNPTNGSIYLSSKFNGAHQLEIINANGQRIFSETVIPGNAINLKNIAAGIYQVQILHKQIFSNQKLIITN